MMKIEEKWNEENKLYELWLKSEGSCIKIFSSVDELWDYLNGEYITVNETYYTSKKDSILNFVEDE